jgi:hypothetical protein
MQIILYRTSNSQAAKIELSGMTRDHSPPIGFSNPSQSAVEVRTGLRWVDVEPSDRGNEQNTIEFSVVRRHANLNDAERFIAKHKAELRGRWKLVKKSDTGEDWIKYVCVQCTGSHDGITTTTQYNIVGGRWRTNANDSD